MTVDILGVPITPLSGSGLVDRLVQPTLRASSGESELVTVLYANAHVLNTAYEDPELHAILRAASTVYVDGSGIRLAAALLGRRLPSRLAAADWIDAVCHRVAEEELNVYFVAGAPGVADRASEILTGRHPGLRVAGTSHGYLDEASSEVVVEEINRCSTDILLVGMGTPVQERWISTYRSRIEAPVVWAVGAVMDFVTGVQRRSPRWMTENHLEWLGRLWSDPRRLGRRYVVGNPQFLLRVMRQRLFGLPRQLSSGIQTPRSSVDG